MRILLAMSGGIDSSVVAHLLKEQGHDVVGVRFTLWSDPLAPAISEILPSKCCNAQTAARCAQVADDLNIPLHIIDLEQEFKENVVDVFLDGYREGKTPNPCIGCNRTIKFGKLIDLLDEYNCDKLATGHYARVAEEQLSDGTSRFVLLEANDKTKDQSYYLYGLGQEQLSKVFFPLGTMQKSEVFALAQKYNVPYDDVSYRESQDLCFFPEKEPKEFLKRYLKDDMQTGEIRLEDETKVGEHEGLPLYTIGQRKGLGIGGLQIPLHVSRKDTRSNTVYVAPSGEDMSDALEATDVHWVSWEPEKDTDFQIEARISSLGNKYSGICLYDGLNLKYRFNQNVRGIAAGQSIVLYRGEEIVGGGVIQ